MFSVSLFLQSGTKQCSIFSFLGTPAPLLTSTLMTSFSCGMSQCQITVVRIVMEWCTKQTLSLKLSSIRINVKQLRLQSAESYQVPFLFTDVLSTYFHFLDHQSASIESEFYYKHCCNDEEGMIVFFHFKTSEA